MALFQQSVLKKYLAELDAAAIQKAWHQFHAHFQHPDIQRQIESTDKEIDAMMYTLYGLTDDEIKIVEGI